MFKQQTFYFVLYIYIYIPSQRKSAPSSSFYKITKRDHLYYNWCRISDCTLLVYKNRFLGMTSAIFDVTEWIKKTKCYRIIWNISRRFQNNVLPKNVVINSKIFSSCEWLFDLSTLEYQSPSVVHVVITLMHQLVF